MEGEAIKKLYSVHVSNIPSYTTADALKYLFNAAGDVMDIYLSPKVRSDSRLVYAFVRYRSKAEVQRACELMNNVKIGDSKLIVALSNSTRERLTGSSCDSSYKSIMRPAMPRMERNRFTVLASDERHIHQKLKASLNCLNTHSQASQMLGVKSSDDVKDFMKELKDVLVKISNVPFGVGVDPINFGAEKIGKSNLEEIIIRYHGSPKYKVPFKDVDIDISDNSLLTLTETSAFFPCLPGVSGIGDELKQ